MADDQDNINPDEQPEEENNGHAADEESQRRLEALGGFIDQRLAGALENALPGAINEALTGMGVPQMVQQFNQFIQAQQQAQQAAQPQPQPEHQQPVMMEQGQAAGILAILNSPEKLGELATTIFQTIGTAKAAFRKDDYAIVREIAERNPVAIMPFAPDPLGGRFSDIFTQATVNGIRIGLNAKGTALSPLVSPQPNPSPGPSALPSAPQPGGDGNTGATPTPTPGATAAPSPTPAAPQSQAHGWMTGDTSNTFSTLPDDALDTLLGQIMDVQVARQWGQQTISVTG